jgi:hypothetical protein
VVGGQVLGWDNPWHRLAAANPETPGIGASVLSVVTIRRPDGAYSASQVGQATVSAVQCVLEQAGAVFIAGGVHKRQMVRPDAAARFDILRAINPRSAEELKSRILCTDDDLCDAFGLPT